MKNHTRTASQCPAADNAEELVRRARKLLEETADFGSAVDMLGDAITQLAKQTRDIHRRLERFEANSSN